MNDMMDFFNMEEAESYLIEAEKVKKSLLEEAEYMTCMILILKHYLFTGDKLDPAAFGYEFMEEDEDD